MTDEQIERRLHEIWDEIAAANPFETFEPHPGEEGSFDIFDLHESRLNRLFVERVGADPNKELVRFLVRDIAAIIARYKGIQ